MNNASFASLSLIALASLASATAVTSAPLRAGTLRGCIVHGGVIATTTRAQAVMIEDGAVTYRDPIGAPTRIETSLTMDAPDEVLALGDLMIGVGRTGEDRSLAGGAFVERGAGLASLSHGPNAAVQGSVDRIDLRALFDDDGPAGDFAGYVLGPAWRTSGFGDGAITGRSRNGDASGRCGQWQT